MASQTRSPTAAVSDNSNGGTQAWANPTNCFASDDARSLATRLGTPTPLTTLLSASDFDFAIPSGATPDGIEVRVERQDARSGASTCTDAEVRLVIGGIVQGTNKAAAGNWSELADEVITYGGPTDKWGLNPDDADLNAIDFGVVVAAVQVAGGSDPALDHIEITVHYTEGGGATDLVIQDASHAHAADSLALTQVHSLSVADASHGHTAGTLALTQVHVLAIADALHAHTSDSPALSQLHILEIEDSEHSHAAENVTLDVGATQLAIQDALHGHSVDSPALTQVHVLAIADAAHAHTADAVALSQTHVLAIQDALHAHTADNVVFFMWAPTPRRSSEVTPRRSTVATARRG